MAHPLTIARKQANLSQEGLAALIGKNRLTILRIENARTQQPSSETVAKIIGVLRKKDVELSVEAFLGTYVEAATPAAPRRKRKAAA